MSSPELFTLPHKALRALFGWAAIELGRVDVEAGDEPSTATLPVHELLHELDAHSSHEDEFILPLLARHLPDLERRLAGDHADLVSRFDDLRRQLDIFERQPSAGAQLALYRHLRRAEALNLVHLDVEETLVMPALWQVVAPQDLLDVLTSFRAAHPEANELYHRAAGALSTGERSLVLG